MEYGAASRQRKIVEAGGLKCKVRPYVGWGNRVIVVYGESASTLLSAMGKPGFPVFGYPWSKLCGI